MRICHEMCSPWVGGTLLCRAQHTFPGSNFSPGLAPQAGLLLHPRQDCLCTFPRGLGSSCFSWCVCIEDFGGPLGLFPTLLQNFSSTCPKGPFCLCVRKGLVCGLQLSLILGLWCLVAPDPLGIVPPSHLCPLGAVPIIPGGPLGICFPWLPIFSSTYPNGHFCLCI